MRTFANHVLYGLAVSVLSGLARLPLGMAYWLGARLGDLCYLVLPRRRRIALDNLTIAFGAEKTARERSQIAKGRARNLTALCGCFVSSKSDGKVVEGDVAASDKHQVKQVPKTCAEPICHPRRQACETAKRACRQAVEDMISEGLHET